MISPTNNKYILSFMEKNFLAFFFIFFFSFSAFAQQDKKLILLQTSDVQYQRL